MTERPLVSIITPTLDPGARLERCIESVRAQTYPRIEHLVVDGGSSDGTIDLLRAQPEIRWISEPDSGQSDAINKGFKMAEGSILGWLNADDELVPRAVEWVVEAFESDPELGWVYGDVLIQENGSYELRKPSRIDKPVTWSARNLAAQPGSFNSRSSLQRVGYLDTTFRFEMDCDLWLRLLNAGVRHHYIPRVLAVFEVHADSKSGSVSHAEFAREEAIARMKNGYLRSAAIALGRAAAWRAAESGTDDDSSLSAAIEGVVASVTPESNAVLPQDLVRAGAVTERALLRLKSKGWRALPDLVDRELWRYPETRSRIKHAAGRVMRRAIARVRPPDVTSRIS